MAGAVEKIVNYRFQMHGARQMGVSLRGLATAGAAVGAALIAAGAAVFALVNRVTSAAAEIEDMSRATGIAAGELAALGYVLEQDGADISALETSIRKMTRTINDANTGMKEYQDTFEQIGVDYESLSGLLPEEQFYILADAIANVEDQSVKMALAQELFGRGAMDLLPTLDRGADGIKEFTEEAREMGIVLGDEVYEKSKAFQDALTEIEAIISGALLEAIAGDDGLLPVIEQIAREFGEWAEEGIPRLAQAISDAMPSILQLVENLGTIIGYFDQIVRRRQHLETAGTTLQTSAENIAGAFAGQAVGLEDITEVYDDYLDALDELGPRMYFTARGMRDFYEVLSEAEFADLVAEGQLGQDLEPIIIPLEIETISAADIAAAHAAVAAATTAEDGIAGPTGPTTEELQQRVWEKTREFVDIENEYRKEKWAEFLDFKKEMQVIEHEELQDFESRSYEKKMEGINLEMQNQQQLNDMMYQGAQGFGQILLRGGEDWEKNMMQYLAKMALQFAAMQIAGPFGGALGFLGGFL